MAEIEKFWGWNFLVLCHDFGINFLLEVSISFVT